MEVYQNPLYLEDIKYTSSLRLPWEKLKNRSILISGATGLLGSYLIDVIMKLNETGLNCKIIALGRNEEKAKERFSQYWYNEDFLFLSCDINKPLEINDLETVDFIIHLASNTHPVTYATDPVGTITTNVIGTQNMFEFAIKHNATRCVFASSNEIYGENLGDTEKFDEKYCGYIDPNTLRAGYPESKRCGEALCQAYIKQKKLDVVISRLTRSYGPTLLRTDSKALSQFLYNGISGQNIILKSEGNQYYSYTYVADAVSGLLTTMLYGKCGEAYNIADDASDIMLRDLANMIASYSGTKVVFEKPNETEKIGFSKATKARIDGTKLMGLGWKAKYDLQSGLERTIKILKQIDK